MAESLFGENPDREVEVIDLFGKKHLKNLKDFRFRISVYGVLYRGKEILMQRHPKLSVYGLPGGGMSIGETVKDTLVREFKEETGLEVKPTRLLSVEEDYFTLGDESAQSVLITYEVEKTGGRLLRDGNNDDTAEVKFINLAELNSKKVQRVFWRILKPITTPR